MRTTTDVPLARLTTLRLGGPAKRVVEAETDDELVDAVHAADTDGEPVLVVGGGSNLVVADAGFPGTVVLVRTRGITSLGAPGELRVAAGEDWDAFVAETVARGLAGVEALSGIPGSVGAAPVQNVGAYGQEVAQTITAVHVWDRAERRRVTLTPAECRFTYRHSIFKGDDRRVVLAVDWALTPSPVARPVRYGELARHLGVEIDATPPLADVREAVLTLRRRKGMVLDPADHDTWSAGSFFTNPVLDAAQAGALPADAPRFPAGDGRVKTSAAWLIEQAGFGKGYGDGAARLSGKHTLALTNRGGATTADLLALARTVRDGVRERFGVELVNEPVIVGDRL